MATSPAQQLMGRRCHTLLPTSEALLRPSYPLRDDVSIMSDRKHYYDRHAKPLPNVSQGEIVRMRLGKKSGHQLPVLIQRVLIVSLSSLEVQFIGEIIITTSKTPVSNQTVVPKEMPLPSSSGTVSSGHTTVHVPLTLASSMPSVEPPSFQPDVSPTDLQRSLRERRPPARGGCHAMAYPMFCPQLQPGDVRVMSESSE